MIPAPRKPLGSLGTEMGRYSAARTRNGGTKHSQVTPPPNPGSLENNFELILKGEEKFPFSNYCNERGVAVLDRERVIVTPFQNSALDSGQHFIEIETNCL